MYTHVCIYKCSHKCKHMESIGDFEKKIPYLGEISTTTISFQFCFHTLIYTAGSHKVRLLCLTWVCMNSVTMFLLFELVRVCLLLVYHFRPEHFWTLPHSRVVVISRITGVSERPILGSLWSHRWCRHWGITGCETSKQFLSFPSPLKCLPQMGIIQTYHLCFVCLP